jgi:hypothetical protein
MFRFIVLVFIFLTSLIDGQFIALITPHYMTHSFQPVQAIITKNIITKDGSLFHPSIHYQYAIDGHVYNGIDIQSGQGLVFKTVELAQDFSSRFTVGQPVVTYVSQKNPQQSYLFKGFDNKDFCKLMVLLPLNLASILFLFLAFGYHWNFEGNNIPMNGLLFGLWGIILSSIIGTILLTAFYHLEANTSIQYSFLCSYLLVGISFFAYRFLRSQSIHKQHRYKRLYKTRDYDVLADEFKIRNPIFSLRQQDVLPLIMINALLGLAMIYNWIGEQFILTNTAIVLLVMTVIFNIFYVLTLAKKYKVVESGHSVTSLN